MKHDDVKSFRKNLKDLGGVGLPRGTFRRILDSIPAGLSEDQEAAWLQTKLIEVAEAQETLERLAEPDTKLN